MVYIYYILLIIIQTNYIFIINYKNLQKKFQILKKIKDEDFTFSFEDEKERDEMYKALNDTLMTNNEQYHKYHQENKKLLSSILKIYENSSKK